MQKVYLAKNLRWLAVLGWPMTALFASAPIVLAFDPHGPRLLLWLLTVLSVGMAVLFAFISRGAWRTAGAKVLVDESGITRTEKDGSSATLAWKDLATLKERRRRQQWILADATGARSMVVDFQFEPARELENVLLDRYAQVFHAPPLPATFSNRSAQAPEIVFAIVIAAAFIGLSWMVYHEHGHRNAAAGKIGMIFMLLFGVLALTEQLRTVHSLDVDPQGVRLRSVLRTHSIAWQDIRAVEWERMNAGQNNLSQIRLLTRDGRSIRITHRVGDLPYLYLLLKGLVAQG